MLKLSRLPNGEPEIFSSIQGEGVTCGLPSIFVRLALCNLRCRWCDTRYTWDWAHYDLEASIITLDPTEVASRALRQAAGRIHNVVLTGGEPLLQKSGLGRLATGLKANGLRIEVETNGTIEPDRTLAALVDQWNVSPKLASSGNGCEEREVAGPLAWFAAEHNAYFKLVVVEPGDLEEVDRMARRYGVPADRVVLMPEGVNTEEIARRSGWLVERCVQSGYRFSTRLHILLWGNERAR